MNILAVAWEGIIYINHTYQQFKIRI